MFGFRDDNKCMYKVKLCGVVFSDIYYVNDKCSFKVNNKKYSATLNQLGVLRLEGDVRKVDWIKKLKKSGRVKVDNDLVY